MSPIWKRSSSNCPAPEALMTQPIDPDLDSLFMLPLAEFTAARNELIKRLKQAKRPDDAQRVKAISKPSISAWAVNQLYFSHRAEFDRRLDAGKRLAEAQRSGAAGDIRERIADRREAVSRLLQFADRMLLRAGHSATPDTLRRIEATLESVSTPNVAPDAPLPGRLTADLAPISVEFLAALVPDRDRHTPNDAQVAASKLKEAETVVMRRENELRQAAENLARATSALEDALRRAEALRIDAEKAEKVVKDADSALQQAR